jgi:hypothetical protein
MGFASGFQVGAQAVERGLRMRDENEQRERIKAAMGLTAQEVEQRQATPDELGRARAEAQAMAAQDAEVFGLTPQEQVSYAPQMPVEGQRIGLNRYQVGQQSFDRMPTQNELEAVRYGAAANILAERDPVAAQRMRRELQIAKQQDELYPLQKQQLEGALAGQAQERDLKGIQLKGLTRIEAEAAQATNFANFAAERPDAPIAELKEAAFKQFKFTPKQWQDTVTTRLGIENAEMDSFKNGIKKKLQGKNLTQLGSLYNSDPDFDDKTDLAIVPGKGGAVTLNFIDKATKKITGTQTFKNDAQAVEYLNRQATEPETIGSWMLNLGKTEAAIAASKAASAASASTSGLNAIRGNLVNRQIKDLDETAASTKEAKKLMTDFAALTEAEQNGPKGRALEKQYNMLVAKPGAQLRVSPEGKAPRAMDEVEKEQLKAYNEWLAAPRNARLSGGEKDAMAEQMGVSHLLRTVRERAAQSSGGVTLGGDAYAADRDAPAAPAPTKQGLTKTSSAPALNTGNTKLLGRAGNSGYSVEMPDGTTRVMSISELNKLGYQFLGGNTGLERPWYDDLLPRR